jgi:hypothetical protein
MNFILAPKTENVLSPRINGKSAISEFQDRRQLLNNHKVHLDWMKKGF